MSLDHTDSPLGEALPQDSARRHVTGQADYCDDLPEPAGCLHGAPVLGPPVKARIHTIDWSAVRASPGVIAILTAADIPGENNAGSVVHDEPVFPNDTTGYAQQPIALVLAQSRLAARRAAAKVRIDYTAEPGPVHMDAVIAANDRLHDDLMLVQGDPDRALTEAPLTVQGQLEIGGQDHVYLEGQIALALPSHDGLHVVSSTQHPTEVQDLIAHMLALPAATITVEVRRMGGAFGGKESQAAHIALWASLGAQITGAAVKVRLDRDDDMRITGKRHEFQVEYTIGHDAQGVIQSALFSMASRCGFSNDLSRSVNDRAVFHADNAYFLPHARIHSKRLRSATVSNTAFRGFGGPQGMMAIERAIDQIAARLHKDPLDVRLANAYGAQGRVTPYGMEIQETTLIPLMQQLAETSSYRQRRAEIEAHNAKAPRQLRGIALTPVKFGISFTASFLNQAGALIHVYKDGSIALNHGGTEMGQGLYQKVAQVVAHVLGVSVSRIHPTSTRTDKVPNTSPTAASSGSDLNGMATRRAAETLKVRLCAHLKALWNTTDEPVFANDQITAGAHRLSFAEAARSAWFARIPLSATGHWATPDIGWDPHTGKGRPFYYFASGAAVSEVEVDQITGVPKVIRADLLHDVGESLNPMLDLGQIEGGYVQGMGWLTMEQLVYSDTGVLATHGLSTYKIPTASDRPTDLRIALWPNQNPEEMVYHSKAVGEPPFMLAISVHSAIAHAVSCRGPEGWWPALNAPATAEEVLRCLSCAASA
ncbi:MAG: xanthine dehydrogenase molybdopterin binding subunit [Litorivicinaceae bacterium]